MPSAALFVVLIAAFSAISVFAAPAAADGCAPADLVERHQDGAALMAAGKAEAARRALAPLASAGYPPSASALARLEAEAGATAEARRWAVLAAAAGDREATDLLARLGTAGARDTVAPVVPDLAGLAGCVRTAAPPVRLPAGFDDRDGAMVRARLTAAFHGGAGLMAAAPLALAMIETVDVVSGDRYDRYIDWKPGAAATLLVSAGFANDRGSAHLSRALVDAGLRRMYAALPGGGRVTPLRWRQGVKTVVVADYPDINPERFRAQLGRALEMAAELPGELGRYVHMIEEIHYVPPSKDFVSRGGIENASAYYVPALSTPERAIVFVRKRALWSSPLELALTLVHEGTHVDQHRRGEPVERAASGGAARAGLLMAMECEALRNEIRAARHLDAPYSTVEKSQYLPLCPEAQTDIVRWRNSKHGIRR